MLLESLSGNNMLHSTDNNVAVILTICDRECCINLGYACTI